MSGPHSRARRIFDFRMKRAMASGRLTLLALASLMLAAPVTGAFDLGELLSPTGAPVIFFPLVGIDPDSGTSLGVIGAWLHRDAAGNFDRIVAPDVLHNSYFGWGLRGRVLAYPSADTSWSLIAGAKQRVEHYFDAEYQSGITRTDTWSFSLSALDQRSGTSRFFGFGNETPLSAQTDYTVEHMVLQGAVGWNISHLWQLSYLLRYRNEDVTLGLLPGLPSIATLFPGVPGLGTQHELLTRLIMIYDSRDNPIIPTRGAEAVLYGGLSSRGGIFNDSLYSEVGIDARGFVPLGHRTVLAMHAALRELPTSHRLSFWAYSTLGGDQSALGGAQPLRGFGEGRFTDVDSFSASVELRHIVAAMYLRSNRIDLELTPFMDVGRVFSRLGTSPFAQLHRAYGLGVRGVARPFIVAYVDVGYGTEGSAAFSGINYIF
jgi:hypothetical protein